jgi:hypothetical protein
LASRLGICRPTDPVSSCSGNANIVATQDVSVIPHTWVNGASLPISARNRACTSLSNGAAPQAASRTFLRNGRLCEIGDIRIAIAIGGTIVRSVIWYFSIVTRNSSRSNRRITYAGEPDLRVDMWAAGAAEAWKMGRATALEI